MEGLVLTEDGNAERCCDCGEQIRIFSKSKLTAKKKSVYGQSPNGMCELSFKATYANAAQRQVEDEL